jgi:hypothetical protein
MSGVAYIADNKKCEESNQEAFFESARSNFLSAVWTDLGIRTDLLTAFLARA